MIEEPMPTAANFCHFGLTYHLCAKQLEDNPPHGIQFDAPARHLYYHSIELFLKAHLISNGDTMEDLEGLGHDLCELYRRAVQRGLAHSEYVESVIDLARESSQQMLARYIRAGVMTRPHLVHLGQVSAELHDHVRGCVDTPALAGTGQG